MLLSNERLQTRLIADAAAQAHVRAELGRLDALPLERLVALAHQAWFADYLLDAVGETVHDRDAVRGLVKRACFSDPASRADASQIAARAWPAIVDPLVDLTIRGPLSERRLVVPTLTALDEDPVHDHYEANPYPRWADLDDPLPAPDSAEIRGDVLVAGCGTGQHPLRIASRHPAAHVLGVDLSRASLAHAERRRRELGIANARFGQADLMRLDGRFDHIESVGVLQHVPDPAAAFEHLMSLLNPGGELVLGVSASDARAPVRAVRRLAESQPATPEGVRRLHQRVAARPALHPVYGFRDFFWTRGCLDLLFHPRERSFDAAWIEARNPVSSTLRMGLWVARFRRG